MKRWNWIAFILCILLAMTVLAEAEDIPVRTPAELPFAVTVRAGTTDPSAREVKQRILLNIRIQAENIAQVSCNGVNTQVEKAQGKNTQVFDYVTHIPAHMPFELLTFTAIDEKGNYVASQQLLILIVNGKAQFQWLYATE